MVARILAYLRPPLVVCGHLVALVLLVLDARRAWRCCPIPVPPLATPPTSSAATP
ncbi:hypothetical protein ACGF3C_16220 [Micromonospora sp. NPDC047762]|uniref:hypothetical protein n=1 Tax=unclassified Micromonospora TaxID=2617518 RepID=UPI0033D198CE